MERNNSYVSCMKLKGNPILPPLITLQRKRELHEYKCKAILLEQLYENRKKEKSTVDDGYKPEVKKLETLFKRNPSIESIPSLIDFSSPSKYVPYKNRNINDISKSDIKPKDCFSLIDNFENLILDDKCERTTSGNELDLDKSVSVDEGIDDKSRISSSTNEIVFTTNSSESDAKSIFDKPRLIRSNSYTLDNPSPILIEHLKKQNSVPLSRKIFTEPSSDCSMSESFCQEKSTSSSSIITELIFPSEIQKTEKSSEKDISSNTNKPPFVEIVTTDITVQQINITTPINENFGEKELIEILNSNEEKTMDDSTNNTDPEDELNLVLKEIPEVYSKKILELLEKQKFEQQKRVQSYENLKRNLLENGNSEDVSDSLRTNVKKINVNAAPGKKILDSNFNERQLTSSLADSSISINLDTTCSESLDDFSVRTVKNLDSEREIIDELGVFNSEYHEKERKNVKDEHSEEKIKKDKAASIIGAHVRGYLIRRLMNTAKVQTLIQTIQDALVCALELQTSEHIEEADVELHRRLIQQVSAACYEFHDVFFDLTIPEQMDLIAIDREKKKRPIILPRSSRSSLEFQVKRSKSSSNVRLSKSLTKV